MRVLIGPNRMDLDQVVDELAPLYPELEFECCVNGEDLARAVADAEIYLGWLRRPEFLAARSLRWIQSPSSGVDMFLRIPELREGEVLLTSARGTHGACLAESALAMILAFTRRIKDFIPAQQAHRWTNRELRPGMVELTGSTMGIVGLGAVGRALARRAAAFDMRILAVDMFPGERPACVERLEGLDGLAALLRESDYVVVTVPLTEQSRGMLGAREIALLKPSAILVGISRGGVIDESALLCALQEGRIKGAALDVFECEPLPEDSPLWDVDNLLITPHAAGGTQFEGATVRQIFAENVGRFLRGEFPLRNQVDKQRGF
jgi:phosphoglycerate dehydrogenase-like enzyme